MICIKADIPKELSEIDDELKAIYHSKDTVCFFILKTRELRNKFIEETKGMNKSEREKIYEQYNNQYTFLLLQFFLILKALKEHHRTH